MSQKTIATLKTYFETGDTPTQSEFEHLIDSSNGSKVRFPKHASLTGADVGKLVMNDGGVAKVANLATPPTPVDGEITFEFTVAPTIPTGTIHTIQLLGQPVANDNIRIGRKTFHFTVGAPTHADGIEIGATLPDTLDNIETALNNYSGANSYFFWVLSVTNDGVDTLTIDFSDPNGVVVDETSLRESWTMPNVFHGGQYEFNLFAGVVVTTISGGGRENWSLFYDRMFVKFFGIEITLLEILNEMSLTPADYTLARGNRWANDETIFSDAFESALFNNHSADLTYTRGGVSGNEFAIKTNGNGSGAIDWIDWQSQTEDPQLYVSGVAFNKTDVTRPTPTNTFSTVTKDVIGVLIGIDGTDAVIDASTVCSVVIGGTLNVTCKDTIDLSISEPIDVLSNILIPTASGTVETFASLMARATLENAETDNQFNLSILSSFCFIPLQDGTVGDTIVVLRSSTVFQILFGMGSL